MIISHIRFGGTTIFPYTAWTSTKITSSRSRPCEAANVPGTRWKLLLSIRNSGAYKSAAIHSESWFQQGDRCDSDTSLHRKLSHDSSDDKSTFSTTLCSQGAKKRNAASMRFGSYGRRITSKRSALLSAVRVVSFQDCICFAGCTVKMCTEIGSNQREYQSFLTTVEDAVKYKARLIMVIMKTNLWCPCCQTCCIKRLDRHNPCHLSGKNIDITFYIFLPCCMCNWVRESCVIEPASQFIFDWTGATINPSISEQGALEPAHEQHRLKQLAVCCQEVSPLQSSQSSLT